MNLRMTLLATSLLVFGASQSAYAQYVPCGCFVCRSQGQVMPPCAPPRVYRVYRVYGGGCYPYYYTTPYYAPSVVTRKTPTKRTTWNPAWSPNPPGKKTPPQVAAKPTAAKPAAAEPAVAKPAAAAKPLDILAYGASRKDLSILMELARETGLNEELSNSGPYTIFAPTNAAFEALGADALQTLRKDKVKLKDALLLHAASDSLTSARLAKMKKLTTSSEEDVTIRADGEALFIGGAKVIEADIQCANGVVHVVERVLTPIQPK